MISTVSNTPFNTRQFESVLKKRESIKLLKSDALEDSRKTDAEQKQIEALKKRDAEVRAHEAAHAATAGGLARGMSFTFKKGPDGQQYAIGGEVQIDTSPVDGDPQATVLKMQQVQRAALAPGDPSGQDKAVAAQAASVEAKAGREVFKSGNEKGGDSVLKDDEREMGFKNDKAKVPKTSVYTLNEMANSTMKLACSLCSGTGCYHAA
ncbi:MAG TPA: putative metalloprotease CJM1_0395 family protein [Patescibacteria group bacterium]|nr:putative metalloprotease CJM1_0395 family protein [Patescibacteria group bacterium]